MSYGHPVQNQKTKEETMNENTTPETTTEEVTETKKHEFTVLAGVEVSVKGDTPYEAGKDALDLVRALTKDVNFGEHRYQALVTHRDYAPKTMDVPEGLNRYEAQNLLTWARENADTSIIDFDEFVQELEENEEWQDVRDQLEVVPVSVFAEWLRDGNGRSFTYRYELSKDELSQNAEDCEDRYLGQGTREEFTAEYYEGTGALAGVPVELIDHIDWEGVFDSAMAYDVTEIGEDYGNSYFFRNY